MKNEINIIPVLCSPRSERGAGNTGTASPDPGRTGQRTRAAIWPQPASAVSVRRRFIPKQDATASHAAVF